MPQTKNCSRCGCFMQLGWLEWAYPMLEFDPNFGIGIAFYCPKCDEPDFQLGETCVQDYLWLLYKDTINLTLAKSEFGTVDYWINNAGYASGQNPVHKIPESLVQSMITTNSLGTVFGSQVAIKGFREQGNGTLYNMLGGSFDGKFLTPGMGVYSSTKASINILTKYLVEENKNTGIIIASISPGVLITENWLNEQKKLSQDEWEEQRPMANIICDHVETVAPWIVSEILQNEKSGIRIAWMPLQKILLRFFKAKVLRQKRDLFSRYGI